MMPSDKKENKYFDKSGSEIGKTALVTHVLKEAQGKFQHLKEVSLKKKNEDSPIANIESQMQCTIKSLKDKRYIIVIDDISDLGEWRAILKELPTHKTGESIVVAITRMNSITPQDQDQEDAVSKIGGGIPLALRSLGSQNVPDLIDLNSDKWAEKLKVAWVDLNQTLFDTHKDSDKWWYCMYISTLPKDSKIERASLIKKWIAENNEIRTEEGEMIFDSLIDRNVIQPRYCFPEEEVYEVHPMMLRVLNQISQECRRFTCSSKHGLVTSFEELNVNLVVLDLEGCNKEVDMYSICDRLKKLRYLGLKNTKITELPSKIKNLNLLEALDVRETELMELPVEVVELDKLNLLLLDGKGNSHGGLMLPTLDGQHESPLLKVVLQGCVDSRKCSTNQAVDKIQVRNVEVVLHSNDGLKVFKNLAQSLVKLKARRWENIPNDIENLSGLTFLDIKVGELEDEGLKALGKINSLKTLVLALVRFQKGALVIGKDHGFKKLENFVFDSNEPWVTFREDAMPDVKHLGLKLYAGRSGRTPSGIVNLKSLEKVVLKYNSGCEGSACVTGTVEVLRKDALKKHGNMIAISINDKDEFPIVDAQNPHGLEYIKTSLKHLGTDLSFICLVVMVFAFGLILTTGITKPQLILSRLMHHFETFGWFLLISSFVLLVLTIAMAIYKDYVVMKLYEIESCS